MSSFLTTITQNFVCTSRLQVRFYAKRAYKKTKNAQLIRAPSRKTLEQPRQVFLFGNFSGLHLPQIKTIETSRKAIESISSFSSLRIFPTVRAAMVQEIKRGYNFKNTYMASKDDLEIKPSPVQVAAIRKINQPRNIKSTKSRTPQKYLVNSWLKMMPKDSKFSPLPPKLVPVKHGHIRPLCSQS